MTIASPQSAYSQREDVRYKKFGAEDTIHIYPGKVKTDDWEGIDDVLVPNLEEDDLYQRFSAVNSAYVPLEEPEDDIFVPPSSVDDSSNSDEETNVENNDVSNELIEDNNEVEEVIVDEPEPEGTDDNTRDEETNSGLETENQDETTAYQRTAESVFTFFSVAKEIFPFVNSATTAPVVNEDVSPPEDGDIETEPVNESNTETTVAEIAGEESVGDEYTVEDEGVEGDLSEEGETTVGSEVEDEVSEQQQVDNEDDANLTDVSEQVENDEIDVVSSAESTDEQVYEDQDLTEDLSATSSTEIATSTEVSIDKVTTLPEEFETYSITLSDFGMPDLKPGESVTGIQLRASLAAKYDLPSSTTAPYFELTFSSPSSTYTVGSVLVEDEVSNAINGGYYLFALPQDIAVADFKDISIRVDFVGDKEMLDGAFLDALWLEVNTLRVTKQDLIDRAEEDIRGKLRRPSVHEVVSNKFDFRRDEAISFNLKYISQRSRTVETVREFLGQSKVKVKKAEVLHNGSGLVGIVPDITVTSDGLMTVVIPEEQKYKLKPGLYTVELELEEGGYDLKDSFDFQWGMLSINPDKAVSPVDETVNISMGALTPNGNTVCDADLRLYSVSPSEIVSPVSVSQSGQCNGNNVIDVPDYLASFTPTEVGTYELYLERLDEVGGIISHTVTNFTTEDNPSIHIVRNGPTRIYPPAPYDMELRVKAGESFTGTLTERVPVNFAVYNTDAEIRVVGDQQELTWNLSILGGASKSVSYSFDAPDISPYLFELGPATLSQDKSVQKELPASVASSSQASSTVTKEKVNNGNDRLSKTDFTEGRRWQIASDATGNMIVYWAGTGSIPAGWSCLSCGSGAFYQNFAVGSSTYNITGGTATHNHTASATVLPPNEAAVSEDGGKSDNISPNTHTHSLTPTIAATSSLPLYRQLRVLQYGTVGEPSNLPTDTIGVFDVASSSLPAGWVRYDAHDGYYIYGGDTVGATGGGNTHKHDVTGTTGAGNGTAVRNRGAVVNATQLTHTHDVDAETATSSNEPPYIEVVLARLTATSAPPTNLIAMWTDEVAPGWTDVSSGSEDPFNNRFLKASTTYGATSGSATSTHPNSTVVTGPSSNTDSATGGSSGSSNNHTHNVNLTNFSTANHLPPYISVIFGKRIGADPVYEQVSFQWYDDENAEPPTDPWPDGASDLAEGESIDSNTTVVNDGEKLRLRINVGVTNSSSTVDTQFKLEYVAANDCSVASGWATVGDSASSTLWRGYDVSGINAGDTLNSSVLASTTILETFEESGTATGTPNEIGPGEYGEWDFAIENNGADPGANYCFRIIEADGTAFATYTTYPQALTNSSPNAPTLAAPFDNEKTASSSLVFRFVTTDPESETLHYEIQIDDSTSFSPPLEEDDSTSDLANVFINEILPAQKEPFTSGNQVKFLSSLSLNNGTTYYWRVRAMDPNGSNSWGEWSDIQSFTRDITLNASAWYQTETDQFDTNILEGIDTSSNQMDLALGSTTGTSTSQAITFADGDSGTVWSSFTANETDSGDVLDYQIEYYSDGSWALIPDGDLPGNSSGFASTTSLLSLDVDTYDVIRVVAIFRSNTGSPSLQDWTIDWGYRVETPTIDKLFPNEKTGTTTPIFEFTTTDPQNDLLEYEISWSTDYNFSLSSTTRNSSSSAGFINLDNGGESIHYTSGDNIQFTIQSGDALTNNTTYWWRVRARDPLADNAWSLWTDPNSFTVDTTVIASTWFQTTEEQFDTNILSGTNALATNTVSVATTATEAILVYGEGSQTAPRYRQWDGSTWGDEGSLNDVGASIRWARVAAGTTREEYVAVTLDVGADVNAQVFSNGDWSDLLEMTNSVDDVDARGFDVAYETLSGDALVVYCDGDANPSYRIWDGTSWGTESSLTVAEGSNCAWIELASDPTSDEIVMIMRGSDGSPFEAWVWNGTTDAWGNSTTLGSISDIAHEGMAVMYEESGGQAIIVTSSGNQNTFRWNSWNGTTWSGDTTQSIGDDLEWAKLARDVGSDAMVLCYQDEDSDVGYIRWTGSAWTGQGEFITNVDGYAKTEPSFACVYEDGVTPDNYILGIFADSVAGATKYSEWNTTAWTTTPGQVNSIVDAPSMQLERTGDGTVLGIVFDAGTNDSLLFSEWTGSWSTTETLETNMSVDSPFYGSPYDLAPRNPGTQGTTIVSPGIDFNDGSGPYWQEMSWNDFTPGSSQILYSIQYFDGNSWEFIPNSALPDNESGTSTGPIDLSGLNKNTYNMLRPYASLSCDGANNCPHLQDWTVEWAEGINVSGSLYDYDQTSAIEGGTIAVAVNGTVQSGKTGSPVGGDWSISNVTVFPGDIVTVFVSGTSSPYEAVSVTRYDGNGDISGLDMSRRHVSLGSNDATSTPITNADLGLIDYNQNEDVFIGYDATTNTVDLCGDTGCTDVRFFVNASTTYKAGGNLLTHDVDNEGTIIATTTLNVSGSWSNSATTTLTNSTVVMSATSSVETIDNTGAFVYNFNNLTFGTTTGNATWTLATLIDVNGDLSVDNGTLARGTTDIYVAGDLSNGSAGYWTGIGTTTFDGATGVNWSDQNSALQNIGNVLIDGSSKAVTLSSNVAANNITIGADDTLDVSTSHHDITVYGDWTNNNNFVARNGEVFFAATTTSRQIDVGGDSFYDLTFTGVGGSWSFVETNLTVGNNFTVATGTVSMPTATTSVAGSWDTVSGTFAHNLGAVDFTGSGSLTIAASTTATLNPFNDLWFSGSGDWTFLDLNATSSGNVNIESGTVYFPSGTMTIEGSMQDIGGSFVGNNGTIVLTSGLGAAIEAGGSSFSNLTIAGSGNFTFVDTNADVDDDVLIESGTLVLPSGTLTVGGSWTNNSSVDANSGTVEFDSVAGSETINFGSSDMYNLNFDSAIGDWTILAHATATNNFVLASTSAFTLNSGQILSVGGTFTNLADGAFTTWDGSTLSLENGTYTINTKTQGADDYETLLIAATANIKSWNSQATTTSVASGGYFYSQDHASTDGDLYVYGDYTRSSGSEYWSSATDFDGTDLTGGSERQANVYFASGATADLSGVSLEMVGSSTASTTVQNQGAGSYTIDLSNGTTSLQYFEMADLGLSGLSLLGSTTVSTFTNGSFIVGVNNGAALTVSSTTIDENPASQFFNINFATTTAISATNTNQTIGTPSSYWWFRNGSGNLYGEAYDNDGGNPGSIRWDDSALILTISGFVYQEDGVNTLGGTTCDGDAQTPIRIVVAGQGTHDGECQGDGSYSVSNVTVVGDPTITVFLNDAAGGEEAVTVTKTATANISDLDLYVNRVITRHEDVTPLTIADMARYDNSDDDDISFTAATSTTNTLFVNSDNELYVWATTTFSPGGTVTLSANASTSLLDGSLRIGEDATFTGASTTVYTVGGSLIFERGATFVPASTTVLLTATTSGKGISIDDSVTATFNQLTLNGSGGDWTLNGNLSATADINVVAGTLQGTGDISLTNGSFYGNGLVSLGGGEVSIDDSNTLGGTQGWTFNDLTLGDSIATGTTTPGSNATTTIGGTLTIAMAHYLDAGSSSWLFTGTGNVFVENGTFLYDTSSVTYGSASALNVLSTEYYDLHFNAPGSSPTYTVTGLGVQAFGDLTVGGASDTTVTFDPGVSDPALNVDGDLKIYSNGTFIASDSDSFTLAGDLNNDGTFTANGGTVTFDGSGTSEIWAGTSDLATIDITGTGDFTVAESATATVAFTIGSDANSFTASTSAVLAVGGTFTNNLGGSATDWSSSELYLYGGGNYLINAQGVGDSYDTLSVGGGTQIRSWSSDATTVNTGSGDSLYSMDHSSSSGDLYIYGDYTKSSGVDHWSYNTDFDGTDISSSPRRADVYVENASRLNYNSSANLSVIGESTSSTTVQNQGGGVYRFTLSGSASTTMNYYTISDTDSDGLILSGTPNVVDLSYGKYIVGNNNDVGLTVYGTVIDNNPALTFTENIFATTSGVTVALNVRATSSASSGWQFANHTGDIDGEDYDDDAGSNGGNPGYIGWDNSSSSITISGTVYQSDRSNPSTACTPGVYNITMVINTDTSTSTDCNGSGDYAFGPISFADNASIVVFIDNEPEDATTVTYDPVTSVGNLDLYEDHLIVRHESASAITNTVLDDYDSGNDNDPDVLYLVTGGDLTVATDTALVVWNNKEFAPGGDVTLINDGGGPTMEGDLELLSGSTYTTVAGETHTVAGSLISASGATYDASTATTIFTSDDAGETININDDDFYNVQFTGSGDWTIADNVFDINSLDQSAGAITLPAGTTTISGYWNSTAGSFTNSGSLMIFDGTGIGNTVTFNNSDVAELRFTGSGSWTMDDANATSTSNVTISGGTLTLPSGSLTVEGSFRNEAGSITHNNSELILATSTVATLLASTSDLYSVTFRSGGTYDMVDEGLALLGDLTITSGSLDLASGTLSIGGSFDAAGGTFEHNSTGTILFNSTDSGETIDPGISDFYNVVFGSATGGWTIISDATTTRNFTLTNAGDFTLQSGTTLYVGNVFDNSVGGSATTWDGSTLILDSGSTYAINSKADNGDDYQNLVIGANTDIESWFSTATTTTVDGSSSWYSQDNADVDGDLYIYGDYHIGTTTEYWSYTRDFNGDDLSGSPRAVSVHHAAGATTTVDGGTLNIVGASGNETLITNQGSGNYAMAVTSGTFNAQYYQYRNLNSTGLSLSGTPSISSLNYGDFELAVNGGRLIDLAAVTLNANASLVITGARFATTTAITGTNVYLTGATDSAWTFTSHTGNLDGEDFDVDGATNCGQIRWGDSTCQLLQQTHYRWRDDDGGLGVPSAEWYDGDFDKRKSVRIDNPNSTTTLNAVVELSVALESGKMQANFGDLRFTDDSGTTTIPYFIASTTAASAEVWVQVPSLPANDTAVVYMYYDYIAATTTTSSSTETFIAADDFEDGDFTEYSAAGNDGTLFDVTASFAYGNSGYGLDNSPDDENIADDGGIARFDQTVSQGETIRYMQYVDSTSADEACVLFGVQSPVSNSQNYAVCLEQVAGTDFIAIVEDAVYNADPAKQLASTTLTYSTGWYEVEIDWGIDDSIFVSLYDDNESLIATTSASDVTYSSGGYGFTYWFNKGGWDNISSRPTLLAEPTVRFGAEVTDGGASWEAAQDTSTTFAAGSNLRLRLAVENSGLSTTTDYILTFADKDTAPSCEAVSAGDYQTVPDAASCTDEAICMYNSGNFTDGDSTADLLNGAAGEFTTGKAVDNNSNNTGSLTLGANTYSELEFAITTSASASSTNYCLRVSADGNDLDTYLKVAELGLRFDPIMGLVYMDERDGLDDLNLNLIGGTTTRVYATTTVTDANGYDNMQYATTTFYHSDVTAACTPDDNNCYISTTENNQCNFTGCSGNSCLLECYADFEYHASPTDDFGGKFWYAFMEVRDEQNGVDFDTSMGQDLTTLMALTAINEINYGALEVASNTDSYNPTTTIQNIGNGPINISLEGTDMTDGGSSVIQVNNQLFATTSFTYGSCGSGVCTELSTTTISNYDLDLIKPTSTAVPVEDIIYWGIQIPFGVASNPHSGVNTFYAVPEL